MDKRLKVTLLPENKVIEASRGDRFSELLKKSTTDASNLIAVKADNEYASLRDDLKVNCTLSPVSIKDSAGIRIYRISLSYMFKLATRRIFPKRRLLIGHALGHSFYYRFNDEDHVSTDEDIEALRFAMQDLVNADHPIEPEELSWADALAYFRVRPDKSTVQLLEELNSPRVGVWRCNDEITVRHSPLAPRTGLLNVFAIEKYGQGFLLRYPPSATPRTMQKRDDETKLFTVYEEHKRWGKILGVSHVAQLNALSRNRREAREFIQTAEALHDRKIAEIGAAINAKQGTVKAVMIAGPSSSGKTTFTKKLALNLRSAGLKPRLISLDDYYKEYIDIPRDEEGAPDFEALEALDIELFNSNLKQLFAGYETEIPIFDFKKTGGRLELGRKLALDEDGVLLFEGIHGLNPNLTPGLDENKVFRIYISALTQLNLDDHNRIPTTDNRLIRRIVRDHQFRRYPAINTLKIWPSVRRGEEKHIFPYQSSADVMFNSALDYELAILKEFAEPLLQTVSPNETEYGEARRLLAFLRNFTPFPVEEIPSFSILREFIGNSGFSY